MRKWRGNHEEMRKTQEFVDSDCDDDDGGGGMKWRIDPWGLPTSRGRSPSLFSKCWAGATKVILIVIGPKYACLGTQTGYCHVWFSFNQIVYLILFILFIMLSWRKKSHLCNGPKWLSIFFFNQDIVCVFLSHHNIEWRFNLYWE